MFTSRLPAPEEAEDYAGYYHPGNLEVPAFLHARLEQLVATFEERRRLNRWLEVGCGAGALMEAARRRGWEVVGTEIAVGTAEAGRERGLDIRLGDVSDLDLPKGEFDVITVVEVLEHVSNVRELLAAVRGLLRPGGALYVTTPHARGLSARLLRTGWSAVAPPEHLQLFSVRGLRAALADSGLIVRRVETHGLNPRELLAAVRNRRERLAPGRRVETSYHFNQALLSNRAGAVFKQVANATLNAAWLGDSLKVVAERPN